MFRIQSTTDKNNAILNSANKLADASGSGQFAFMTRPILSCGSKLLKSLDAHEKDTNKLHSEHNLIIVGTITLAMTYEQCKYGEPVCPISFYELLAACGIGNVDFIDKDPQASKKVEQFLLQIGQKVLIEKSLPLFDAAERFSKQGIAIQQLLINNVQPEQKSEANENPAATPTLAKLSTFAQPSKAVADTDTSPSYRQLAK